MFILVFSQNRIRLELWGRARRARHDLKGGRT
jgi:hypothetical protein